MTSKENKSHELLDFMLSVTQEMALEYERIQKRAVEVPGTAGDQGEEIWATLLRNWLPPIYQVVTKGRILSYDGFASSQVDVIVLRPSYPKHLLDKKLYLAGGIAAVFECKVTLKASHILSAVKNAAEIRRHLPWRHGSPYKHLNSPIIFGLLAHSHIWKGDKSTPLEHIKKHLWEADSRFIKHPREMLDLLCVANLTTWHVSKIPFLKGSTYTGYLECTLRQQFDSAPIYTAIGEMIALLLSKLAWEDPSIRELAKYFDLISHGARSGDIKKWKIEEVLSLPVRERLLAEQALKEQSSEKKFEIPEAWDEWTAVPLE